MVSFMESIDVFLVDTRTKLNPVQEKRDGICVARVIDQVISHTTWSHILIKFEPVTSTMHPNQFFCMVPCNEVTSRGEIIDESLVDSYMEISSTNDCDLTYIPIIRILE